MLKLILITLVAIVGFGGAQWSQAPQAPSAVPAPTPVPPGQWQNTIETRKITVEIVGTHKESHESKFYRWFVEILTEKFNHFLDNRIEILETTLVATGVFSLAFSMYVVASTAGGTFGAAPESPTEQNGGVLDDIPNHNHNHKRKREQSRRILTTRNRKYVLVQ